MKIEASRLFKMMKQGIEQVPACPHSLFNEFEKMREIIQDDAKYIVLSCPEFTPHDARRHLDNLFFLSDRLLGESLYKRLQPSELIMLGIALMAHDWGMAVTAAEKEALLSDAPREDFAFIQDEPQRARQFIFDACRGGVPSDIAWSDYVRLTHGLRSGSRLRKHFEPLGNMFADGVARLAEGHTLTTQEIRDHDRYPLAYPVFGETVNLAALAIYVRIIDLLDIGDDRTPYALWKFVTPMSPVSKLEWKKHRALSPISVRSTAATREVLVGGHTDDPAVYSALSDLRYWIDGQFAESIAQLRTMRDGFDPGLDSRILWKIDAVGFKPTNVRFEFDRPRVLELLSEELYRNDRLAFIRELLQNSVDAIDLREALLAKVGVPLKGEISVRLESGGRGLTIEWSDNGIGMDEEVLSSYFARLGRSWYQSREANRIGVTDAISKFGVGILSCFAVSRSLRVETRKDPHAGSRGPGLEVEIPSQDSHFRIREVQELHPGTKIQLVIMPQALEGISGESICRAIARISRLVRHQVSVEYAGEVVRCAPPGKVDRVDSDFPCQGLDISLRRLRGDAAQRLESLTKKIGFAIGSSEGPYQGFYSNLIPIDPESVGAYKEHNKLPIAGLQISLDEVSVETEQALFVKGIQVGPVAPGHRELRFGHQHEFPGMGWTNWIKPRILVNLRSPSDLQFSLDRSSVRFTSEEWITRMWREIAVKLRESAFGWPLDRAVDAAKLIGSCGSYGAIPEVGLDALVSPEKSPLLVLRPGEGPRWAFVKDFLSGESFQEAPFELAYACAWSHRDVENVSSKLAGWEGDVSLISEEGFGGRSNDHPWLHHVVSFGHRALRTLGWKPVEIALVKPPENDALPLVCRVWRRVGTNQADRSPGEDDRYGWRHERQEWELLKQLYREAPELLRFPEGLQHYAGFGSRYWNVENPKVSRIASTLKALADRFSKGRLSAASTKDVSIITSNGFYGYVVPARHSEKILALEVPNGLLDIAEREGLNCSDRLDPSDFFPGTVGRYENPYWLNLEGWKSRNNGLGGTLS
jgi:hypothetical protein